MQEVHQFRVLLMSEKFYEQFMKHPEIFDASSITIAEKEIKGSEILTVKKTMEEVFYNLPKIFDIIPEPKNQQHVIVIQVDGVCELCKNDKETCLHPGIMISGFKKILGELDIEKMLTP